MLQNASEFNMNGAGGFPYGGGFGFGGGLSPFGLVGLFGLNGGRGLFGGDCDGRRKDDCDDVAWKALITKEVTDSREQVIASNVVNLLTTKDLATETALGFGAVALGALANTKDTEILMLKGFNCVENQMAQGFCSVKEAIKDSVIENLKAELLEAKFDRKFDAMHSNFQNLAVQVGTVGSAISQFASNLKV